MQAIIDCAHAAYVSRIASGAFTPWWDVVLVTASSARQAERYREQIQRRRSEGKLPPNVVYNVIADLDDQRIGSGGATLNALRRLPGDEGWWSRNRVLIIHSGGDSRRLPQYSPAGKLFTVLPTKTPWGEASTVFDELLALSTPWAARVSAGLLVSSGDVVLTLEAGQLDFSRPGVSGVAIRQPAEVGAQHGVYVADEHGRVYSFLQKPSPAQVRAAGGMFADGRVALDTGLLYFAPPVAARLARISADVMSSGARPQIDLYEHMTLALTGQWSPEPEAHAGVHKLAACLAGVPFWRSLVEGEFTHVGTTAHFRRVLTEGQVVPGGSAVVLESVIPPSSALAPNSIVMECNLRAPVGAGRGAILHGLSGLEDAVEVPEDVVAHQVPVALPDGRSGTVIRAYGVEDDPKAAVSSGGTWFGRPILETLAGFGMPAEAVWPGNAEGSRSLWNAALFPIASAAEAWAAARWQMGFGSGYTVEAWLAAERLSLETSARWADTQALADARIERLQGAWRAAALSLAHSGTDLRPMLAHAPGITAVAAAGRDLSGDAIETETRDLTEAASRHIQASLFLVQAGLASESGRARDAAFRCVQAAVDAGAVEWPLPESAGWACEEATVSAPARIDLGGGWSDTPPFCLDWGGTVLNIGVELDGAYPVVATVRRIGRPVLRCVADGEVREFESIAGKTEPGDPFAIPKVACQMLSIGGGIEIETAVNLPMGSGLGTSSILAAAILQALAAIRGLELSPYQLSDLVMAVEQRMTTGGGWQDQAGGIFPGAKLVSTGPGLRQRLRVQPVDVHEGFLDRLVLHYTGIRRVAKNLLTHVVGAYLAREAATVQVLHSIKTLAAEMAFAMRECDWPYLGKLLRRHWELNQVLDPNTTNAPITNILRDVDRYLAGAKLAGAGGGGYMILLAHDRDAAKKVRERLGCRTEVRIAESGLKVSTR